MADYKKYEPIFGAWYIKQKIGTGSFGEVYEIERQEFGKTYRSALKAITVPFTDDEVKTMMADGTDMDSIATYYEGVVKDIAEENAIMSELKGNSNIVSYEDHQIIPHENGIGYDILIRMELLTSLIDYMIESEMTEGNVLKLGVDLCQALILCEQKKILHRDIKPGNIFVSEAGDFKLGDFGIARTFEKTASEMSRKGTYTYMAPEVYKGEKYGIRADIYSLGIVMYYLLNCKRTPFLPLPPEPVTHDIKMEAMQRRMDGEELPAPREADPKLAEVVLKACAYDPEDRYHTPEEFRDALLATGIDGQTALNVGIVTTAAEEYSDDGTMLLNQAGGTGEPSKSGSAAFAESAGAPAAARVAFSRKPAEQTGRSAAGRAAARPDSDAMEQTVLDVGQFSEDDYNRSIQKGRGSGDSSSPQRASSGKGKKIAMIVAAVLIIGIGGFFASHAIGGDDQAPAEEKTELQPEDIKILDSDINYSQLDGRQRIMTLEDDGVDMLIRIKNNGSVPVRSFNFQMKLKGNSEYLEDIHGDDEFTAIGYVKAGQKGCMYTHLRLPNSISKKQAGKKHKDIDVYEIREEGFLGEYDIPMGEVTGFDKKTDTYKVKVANTNSDLIIHENSYVLAIRKDINSEDSMDGLWGAGILEHEIAGNDKDKIEVIYNPGFTSKDYDRYQVLVYDPEYLDNPDYPEEEEE